MPDLTDTACLSGQKIADKTMPKICHYLCVSLFCADKNRRATNLLFTGYSRAMKKFSFMSLVVIAGMIIPASASFAETRIESVVGTVTKVDILTQSYIRKTPKDERICAIEEVPVYGEGKQGDEIGSMIIGGLIGSAVGNKLSSADGGGAAGAVAGALLGRQHAKNSTQQGNIVGYRQQEVCQTKRILLEEEITKTIGYRLQIEADGRILTIEDPSPASVGDRVEIRKQVSYSLN